MFREKAAFVQGYETVQKKIGHTRLMLSQDTTLKHAD